jgi:hypothetical protein
MSIETTRTVTAASGERADLLQTLAKHRAFLRFTVRDLTDEQAARRTTVSELCLGGLIKHVAAAESNWVDFILGGPEGMAHGADEWNSEAAAVEWPKQFQLLAGETLAGVLEHYDEVDRSHPLPSAPWFEPGARWSARRALLHIIAETAQHAGHADILREAIDGSKTMG